MINALKMTAVINEIATQHNLDLTKIESHLRLEQPGYDCLVIEVVGPSQISVAHYFEQNGDLITNPELVFFTGFGDRAGWIPIASQQPPFLINGEEFGGYRSYARVSRPKGDQRAFLSMIDFKGIEQAVELAEFWAENIRAQGWLNLKKADGETEPAPTTSPTIIS